MRREVGPEIQWVTGHMTGDRPYRLYIGPGPELIREHAARREFRCDRSSAVRAAADPTTAER